MHSISLRQLGELLRAEVLGDADIQIHGISGIEEAEAGDISFVANPKYVARIRACRASALIVGRDLVTDFRPLLVTDDPYLAFTRALKLLLGETSVRDSGIHERAIVAPTVRLGEGVSIMANALIEDNVEIGDRSSIYPGTFIGEGSRIGQDAVLYPNVTICPNTIIGNNVIIHGGTRLISKQAPGQALSTRIILGDDVEFGANVTVTGGGTRDTVISRGTKIDNLVGIRAGAQLGENCIIVAQVTVGEDVTLEERVTLAGQVVVAPGVTIGAHAMVGAKSYVEENLAGKQAYSGSPAQSHGQERRLHVYLRRVPDLQKRISDLEEQVQHQDKENP
ncbi:MAG TPA: UDP-3-O-(3-hydroxymyristoyl)glucosamine N-acyltransferase [bacterium]|nr:UDP-3-O-(3-hydroxymyristoyl)glucosamine N-acyltransferase [bacterium]HPO08528.1 UDP-3-O-(3-hydroxymyristoyl)glucosamine N-acyltransferase [bacterium]HQO34742.1 UDP-3-O-(3-hydroxymyristoyl)glucosamine N-acyltransferase [bacterium]HQP98063.1 UDP-3-O-(3-hydroxymyristoyl)glucosamine N-acyltransferase [bacterium]